MMCACAVSFYDFVVQINSTGIGVDGARVSVEEVIEERVVYALKKRVDRRFDFACGEVGRQSDVHGVFCGG